MQKDFSCNSSMQYRVKRKSTLSSQKGSRHFFSRRFVVLCATAKRKATYFRGSQRQCRLKYWTSRSCCFAFSSDAKVPAQQLLDTQAVTSYESGDTDCTRSASDCLPFVPRYDALHKFVEEWDSKRGVSVGWAPNHALRDQARASRTQ